MRQSAVWIADEGGLAPEKVKKKIRKATSALARRDNRLNGYLDRGSSFGDLFWLWFFDCAVVDIRATPVFLLAS